MTQTACRTDVDQFCSRLSGLQGESVAAPQTVVVARAPAVVDVMGGAGEESGGLVLQAALDVAVAAAASPRADGRIVIRWIGPREQPIEHDFSTAILDGEGTPPVPTASGSALPFGSEGTRSILLLLRQLAGRIGAAALRGGVTVSAQSDWPTDAQLDLLGVLPAAVAEAVTEALGQPLDAESKAECCRAAAHAAGRLSAGIRAPLAALLAEPGSLLLVQTQPHAKQSALEMPAGVVVVALDTEIGRPVAAARHAESRIAAAMGHAIIRELIRRDGRSIELDAKYLANVTPDEFVRRFRNRVPTRLTGKAFLATYGPLPATFGPVDPAHVYKIRSRAEHVIYENKRVQDFAGAVPRARRMSDPASIEAAGALMHASHWSHSQRCGVGSLETDLIATLLRSAGPAKGFYGAKSTGYGTGGGMVVLMRDTPECYAELARQLAEVQARTGRRIRVFRGAAAGASRAGTRRLDGARAVAATV